MEEAYKCKSCGKELKVKNGSTPQCCGKPMNRIPLDLCTQPAHAEHTRPMESEDACNDGRSG